MESSIAKFLWRQPACERLPTNMAFYLGGRLHTRLETGSLQCRAPVRAQTVVLHKIIGSLAPRTLTSSQRSLHNAPIFRLLLKVAVNGTHQCDFLNF